MEKICLILKQNFSWKKSRVSAGIKPRTLRVLGGRENYYTTETQRVTSDVSSRYLSDKWSKFGGR